jgi:N-acetyl-anhydromuramyl-L-alanine amidase AmpD
MPAYTRDDIARAIIGEGVRRGISPRGIQIALATALVESNLTMYANNGDPESLRFPHDALSFDANSVGVFQQRAPWWGTVADRMDPARSAGLFYAALQRLDYDSPAHTPGWYAQQVQRSAFPSRYDERFAAAVEIFNRLGQDAPAAEGPKVAGGGSSAVAGAATVSPPPFRQLDFMTGGGRSPRTRKPTNWLLHTEEGNSSAEQLARYCDGSHNVSYHYTLRDGVLCKVVDTDSASWSVLSANAFTLNLCFAGSKAGWSRAQWLAIESDIEIAAYIAARDCGTYSIPADVIMPPYHAAPGISDHKYVTEELNIGTHHDVGDNFPWDVFAQYVNKYATAMLAGSKGTTDTTAQAGVVLRRGSTGPMVEKLQERLRTAYSAYAGHLVVDGDYGPLTEAAVREFQHRAGLTVDGIAGPVTLAALKLSF